MKVHAALNAATDSRKTKRRPAALLANQSGTSGSSSSGSDLDASTSSASDDASASSESDMSESDPDIIDALHDPADSESDGEDEVQLDPAALQDADTQQLQQQAQRLRTQMK